MAKPRILYVITSSGVGGAERTLFNLISRLDRGRFDIAGAVSLKPGGEYAEKIRALGVRTESLEMGYVPSPSDLRRLKALIRESRADIVHAFLYRAIQFCRLAKGEGVFKLVSSPRVNYRTRAVPLLWLDCALKCRDDLSLCESQSSADFLVSELGYKASGVKVIRNGIDSAYWSFSRQERDKTRASLGLGEGGLLIVSSGRLDRQKGHEYLLRAMPEVLRARPDSLLAIAGSGPLELELKKIARELRVEGRVQFMGTRRDMLPLLCACDIFALPSLWEGLPNSLLEAMSVGRACIASAVDGVRELLDGSSNGLLTEAANSHSIAQALLRLSADGHLRLRLGAAARDCVEREHTFARMLALYESAYDGCLGLEKQ